MTPKARAARLVLAALLAAAALRLGARVVAFVTGSLQLDYAAYDTAGDAVRAGLDPYRTWPDHEPPLWDGKSPYTHSRFLYPPLVAFLFAPLAALPYAVAKSILTLASLLALGAAFLVLTRGLPVARRAAIALGLMTAHPLLALLERGQVDAFTLLLVTLAFAPALRGRVPGLGSGLGLALATLLKLNAAYLAAFWLIRRFRSGLLGFALGGAVLVLLSLAVHGPAPLRDYATRELPRIARYGEDGPRASRLAGETLERLRGEVPEGFVRRDGHPYAVEPFGFVANASLARVLARALRGTAIPLGAFVLSLMIVAVALGFAARASPSSWEPTDELAFLSTATAAVLLAGPLTWAMNVVWLLPAAVLLAVLVPPRSRYDRRAVVLLGLGLLLAWAPDQHTAPWLYPWRPSLGDYKYVVAEVLVLAGGLARLGRSAPGP